MISDVHESNFSPVNLSCVNFITCPCTKTQEGYQGIVSPSDNTSQAQVQEE